MVSSCCAIDCTNRVGSSSCGRKVTFHRFPAENMRRMAWVKAVNRLDPNEKKIWIPSKTAVLCSEHFKMDDIQFYRGSTVLKKDAVPSKFSFQQCKATEVLECSSKTSTAAMTSVPVASSSTMLPCKATEVLECSSKTSTAAMTSVPVASSSTMLPCKATEVLKCSSKTSTAAIECSSKTSTAAMTSVPVASSSTVLPVQPSFIFKEHSYAILASRRALKRKTEHLEERLFTMRQALYNAERRESRAKLKIKRILEKLEKERLLTSETKQLLKVFEDIPMHLWSDDEKDSQ